jgi:nicotinamidase-related amidase
LNVNENIFAKSIFSMCTDEVLEYMQSIDKRQVILCGLETHICILQTAFDLIQLGKEVHIVCDAVSSQR